MPRHDASDLAIRLGQEAEAVCRHYLSNGRRQGNYWLVGDVRNTPGRSMFVRLTGPETGKGAQGRWTDMATGQHGDLLDLIRECCGFTEFRDVAEEARRFLALPHPQPEQSRTPIGGKSNPTTSAPESARRLFAMAEPISGTLAETYLNSRGITFLSDATALRFHPRCYYRPDTQSPTEIMPAMITAVTDLSGHQTGAHRTWLAPDGSGKAAVATPRRAMGELLGHGVRFGTAGGVLAAGEGIETVLSVRQVLPTMPMLAALSTAHLAAIRFPPMLQRLYILCDRDPAGEAARDSLTARAVSYGIEVISLLPVGGDFNDDLCRYGLHALRAMLRDQLHPEETHRFLAGKRQDLPGR
ncbi:toprim domain-containing protein [Paracoccus onubensis]|uniref:DUF7146 domain-containing protein n=1 Tax=Paracoccus onubensis TaxID=1675788 RepID=UPI002730BF8B|nr:toprim domain-containing protein [Paracoccus onubensis]MDP0926557.1 toprim domain-containing protein [Paracoccus onubensis]